MPADNPFKTALAARARYVADFSEAAAGVDLVLTPTLVSVAPPLQDDLELRERLIKLTYPFNATGWPCLAIPCGPAEHGLPASVSLSAPKGDDALVLGVGSAVEPLL